jgi:hypothetical protein
MPNSPKEQQRLRAYGAKHKLLRKRFAPMVEAGLVRCARCGELIEPGTPWDLGHRDGSGKTLYQGPECRKCNRATAKHRKRAAMRWSRAW